MTVESIEKLIQDRKNEIIAENSFDYKQFIGININNLLSSVSKQNEFDDFICTHFLPYIQNKAKYFITEMGGDLTHLQQFVDLTVSEMHYQLYGLSFNYDYNVKLSVDMFLKSDMRLAVSDYIYHYQIIDYDDLFANDSQLIILERDLKEMLLEISTTGVLVDAHDTYVADTTADWDEFKSLIDIFLIIINDDQLIHDYENFIGMNINNKAQEYIDRNFYNMHNTLYSIGVQLVDEVRRLQGAETSFLEDKYKSAFEFLSASIIIQFPNLSNINWVEVFQILQTQDWEYVTNWNNLETLRTFPVNVNVSLKYKEIVVWNQIDSDTGELQHYDIVDGDTLEETENEIIGEDNGDTSGDNVESLYSRIMEYLNIDIPFAGIVSFVLIMSVFILLFPILYPVIIKIVGVFADNMSDVVVDEIDKGFKEGKL